jgi:hypothetical protein
MTNIQPPAWLNLDEVLPPKNPTESRRWRKRPTTS